MKWRSTSVAMCVLFAGEKVSFPVAWHGALLGLGGPLADGDRIDDLSQSALRGAALGLAHLPRRTQVRHQLLLYPLAGAKIISRPRVLRLCDVVAVRDPQV
jgi:hypothetical protein